ncbi:hypothetical protein RB213_011390 [Colletotrichum asianum]
MNSIRALRPVPCPTVAALEEELGSSCHKSEEGS